MCGLREQYDEDSIERSIQLVTYFSYQNQNNLVNCSMVFQKKTKSDQEVSLVKFVQRVSFVRKLFPRRNIRRSCVLTRNAHIWPNRQPQYHTLGYIFWYKICFSYNMEYQHQTSGSITVGTFDVQTETQLLHCLAEKEQFLPLTMPHKGIGKC